MVVQVDTKTGSFVNSGHYKIDYKIDRPVDQPIRGAVLFAVGYSGDFDQAYYTAIAERFHKYGIVTMAFNPPGCGSHRAFNNGLYGQTAEEMMEDTETCRQILLNETQLVPEETGFVGTSFGAFAGFHHLSWLAEDQQPSFAMFHVMTPEPLSAFKQFGIINPLTSHQWEQNDAMIFTVPSLTNPFEPKMKFYVTGDFKKQCESMNIYNRAHDMKTPMIFVQGTKDILAPMKQIHKLMARLPENLEKHLYEIKGAGHGFTAQHYEIYADIAEATLLEYMPWLQETPMYPSQDNEQRLIV